MISYFINKPAQGAGYTLGRIYHVAPGSGERYYLRVLLNHIKGPTCYEEIRTINGTLYATFREACYAMGLLDDDREYIDGIKEASFWGTAGYLRNLFVMLYLSGSMSSPHLVWAEVWKYLSDDILARQRRVLRNNGMLSFMYMNLIRVLHYFFNLFSIFCTR